MTITKTNALNWFELFVSDFERAKKFYDTILDETLEEAKMDEARMGLFPYDAKAGVGGAITLMEGHQPGPGGTVVYLNVEGKLDEVLARVPDAGGKVIRPRFAIGEHGFIAIIADSEGNVLGLHSMS